jgi:hypothetical protein
MNVSGASSSQSAAAAEAERGMLVLKKQQDVSRVEGQALVALIEKSASSGIGGRINVYA